MDEEKEEKIKIILLGEISTGKTSLINVYFNYGFSENEKTSVSSAFFQGEITVNEKQYLVELWDTAGQEKYRSLTKNFIRESNIVIFVYDITDEYSFNEIENYWVDTVKEELKDSAILGIAGNKLDLFENEAVDSKKGRELAEKIGGFFKETSAKENPKGFQNFVKFLIEQFLMKKNIIKKGDNVILEESSADVKNINKKKKCSC